MEAGRLHVRAVLACVLAVLTVALGATGASAQDDPLHGADFVIEPAAEDDWIDPAVVLGYEEWELEPVPDVDLTMLNASPILATGVETIPVEDDTLAEFADRHLRAHQLVATVERTLAETNDGIADLRPRIDELNNEITVELDNEARLTFEIQRLHDAIAEFAVRAFIGDDNLEVAFSDPIIDVSETTVLSDGVRDAQFTDIANKEAELEASRLHRAGLESERRRLRSVIDGLQASRLDQLADLRWAHDLVEATAELYEVELHRRLTDTVEGADFQLVTLNAYVIAARTLADEMPECAIEWWMLAGIGSIESLHGRIGDTTIDRNGHTTIPIYGPALDGRILEGEELITAGSDVPEPTDRTEDLPVAAAAESVDPDAAPGSEGDGDPEIVIRRLALIEDTDGGELDGDTTYDRAVGPMQFIPQTWNSQKVDGNGDGDTDPQNVYDAALASANYLCASTSTMATVEGQEVAYFAYNQDTEYTIAVIEASERYREMFTFPEPPEPATDVAQLSSALVDAGDEPAEPTFWLGIGAFDAETPTGVDIELDLPDW